MRTNKRGNSRITAKHVAEAAGVSQATVSMALRGSEEISPARIAQIQKLARQMSYHPRAAAQLLRSKRSGQIGILTAATGGVYAFSRGFTGPLIGGVVDACIKQQLRYVIEFSSNHASGPVPLPYQVTSGLVDGSVFVGDIDSGLRRRLAREVPDYPSVSLDEPSPFCVLSDSRGGVREMVHRLAGLGHKRLAYAGGPKKYHTHREGFAGWIEATEALGLATSQKRYLEFGSSEEAGIESVEAVKWARRLLSQPTRPTAFICHDMVVARAVIHAALEAGLNVPRDISVMSWGWHVTAQEQFPALSTTELDYQLMIERAMDLLNRLIDKQPVSEPKIVIPLRYIEGATVAPVSS